MIDADIRTRLSRLVARHGSQKALALKIGISPAFLHDVLNARRHPGPRILGWLGLERSYTAKRKKVSK